jgi:hypothetical protein
MTGSPWEKILAGILAEFFSQPTAAPQAKRPFWKAGAFYAALAAAVAAVGAAVSAGAALYSIREASDIASQDQVRQTVQLYLTTYREVEDKVGAAAFNHVEIYNHLNTEAKSEVQIVLGLLVNVVDAMYAAQDPRKGKWSKFIRGIPGPLADDNFDLTVYAAQPETKAAIRDAQQIVRTSLDEFK